RRQWRGEAAHRRRQGGDPKDHAEAVADRRLPDGDVPLDRGARRRRPCDAPGRAVPRRPDPPREGDGTVVGHAEIVQSAWGIKPYAGFLGALKLRDAVDVDVDVSVPLPD